MPESCSEPLFMGKSTLTSVKGVSVGADGLESLVEGLSSGQLFLEGGSSSSLVSEISPKRSSNKSPRPGVLDPARDTAKWPQAFFSIRAPLVLSVEP